MLRDCVCVTHGHVHSHEDAGSLVQEVLLLLGGALAAHAVLDHAQQRLK